MAQRAFPRRGLYLITPDNPDTAALLAQVEAVLPFAACLQYRNKQASDAQQLAQAQALRALTWQHGVCFIVNDAVALAEQVQADGVHLGRDDGSIAQARSRLGAHVVIGASCYASLARAEKAVAEGADYVAFGALFASPTKTAAPRVNAEVLQQAQLLPVPKVAIGGITAANAAQAQAAGADLIAVVSGVFAADDPVAAARACAAVFC